MQFQLHHFYINSRRVYVVVFVDSDASRTTVSTATRSLRKAKLTLQKWQRAVE